MTSSKTEALPSAPVALYVSALRKSSGKTTVSLGLCRALADAGYAVQPFKKGPDYIDPLWLSRAARTPCENLDFHTMGHEEIGGCFMDRTSPVHMALVEGNKGVHDGVHPDGRDSNAALAKLLGIPVLLVVETQGIERGIAPLVLGCQAFDPELSIAGVWLNRVKGERHEMKLRRAIRDYTNLPVLGALSETDDLRIAERHLGLVPANEHREAERIVSRAARAVTNSTDLEQLIAHMGVVPKTTSHIIQRCTDRTADVRIGVARNEAFGFYYPGDLMAIREAGAEVVEFDPIRDTDLPTVDGVFIGGGFPEVHMRALEANRPLRRELRRRLAAGMPAYAECGGLMYLGRTLQYGDHRADMVGALDVDVAMFERPQGRGLVRLRETADAPWPRPATQALNAHEFHYGGVTAVGSEPRFAYQVLRGYGLDGEHDGLVQRRILASFSHLRDTESQRWTERFVAFVRNARANPAG